ncbi:hypothetical protein GCM10010172_43350 [Paractinoplanes ferrugineus]|uniref:Uncharacterized protein n=1 Tax=Paractinoplanes ferrugineus TaxID=113564 RepID=A0A919J3W3_9ACTN|nr:hypothetical protein [Actinoplanes ferrugineus]GIE13493.1 hypothetical protein Afe05nite_53330 [Actinoplanes ferrugineus]
MPAHLWEALSLDRPAIEAQVRFHRAYADLEESPFDVRAIVEMMRYGPPAGVGDGAIDLFGRDAQVLEQYRPAPSDPWIRPGEIADSLRLAAIANLLLDTRAGRADLIRAGHVYRDVGLPFGDFLLVAATGNRGMSTASADRLFARAARLLEPVQRIYLFLAAVADLGQEVTEVPGAPRSIAVGAAAQPFSTWWQIGDLTSRLTPDNEEIRSNLNRVVAEVARAHGRQLEFAMADSFHWSTGHSRVDVVDLDLACAVAIAARVMTARGIRRWDLEEEFDDLSPFAQVSITIGLQLGGEDPTPEGEPEFDPLGPAPDREDEQHFDHGFG